VKPVSGSKRSEVPFIWFLEAVENNGGNPSGDVLLWLAKVCEEAEAAWRGAHA
jgi:hypothetical protein